MYIAPPAIPVSVLVGNTGVIGTETLYMDMTATVLLGTNRVNYVIEADTANTAIVNFITANYDATGTVLLSTTQNRYRIAQTGSLTPLSIDTIDNLGIHLRYTYQ